jgi:hypothetical protein
MGRFKVLMVVSIKIMVFWDVTHIVSQMGSNILEGPAASIFRVFLVNRGRRFL